MRLSGGGRGRAHLAGLGLLVLEAREPLEPPREVPVPLAQELHRRREENRSDDRCVEQDRRREPDAELLEEQHREGAEDREDPDHHDCSARDDPRSPLDPVCDRVVHLRAAEEGLADAPDDEDVVVHRETEQDHEQEQRHDGSFNVMCSVEPCHRAPMRETPASAFATAPTVAGTISSRSSSTAAIDWLSVPLPAIGIEMLATVASLETAMVIGPCIRLLARARVSSSAIALRTAGVSTLGTFTTTFAGRADPGNDCCMRLYVSTAGSDDGKVSAPGVTIFSPSAGAASATMRPPERTAERTGRRRTRSTIAPQIFPSPSLHWSLRTTGRRSQSTLSPSRESRAGSTVSEPTIAIATTAIVATAKDANIAAPVRNMPDIATITVRPEMSTDRPEVAAAASRAARSARPAARSSRSRFK